MFSEYSALRPKDSKTRSSRDGRNQSKHTAKEKLRFTPASAFASTGNWKDLLDAVEADDVDLWDGVARHDRPVWKGWLEKAEQFSRFPKKPLSKDVVKMVLGGDIDAIGKNHIVNRRNEVTVFVSSTFTDTKAERNELMKDVYPYMRMLCQRLGLEFDTVDMRWGVTDDTIKEHGTANMCLQQIDRCLSSSVGPAFLCILGNKYGRTTVPTEIDREEFESLLDVLVDDQTDTSLLRQYFELDSNNLSPKYVLKPTGGVDGRWNEDHREMQKLLRLAAGRVLSDERSEKYFISVTEMEVHCGILNNGLRDHQVILLHRDLAEVTSQQHLHRHLVDMEGNQLDQNAARWLKALRESKLENKLPENNVCKVRYEQANLPAVREYVKNVCDELCQRLTLSVLDCYKRLLHRQTDATFNEALHHRNVARDRTSSFVGRDDLLKAIRSYLNAADDRPFVVHGESGCGKTALLAMAAKMASSSSVASSTASSRPAVVVRFIGTSSASSTVRSLLHSICSQITSLYDGDVTEVPQSYSDLIEYFEFCLQTFATTEKPLVVILDSLDQLANENYAHNLHWLSLTDALPANVRLILSTVSGRCLDVLNRFVPPANVLQVVPLRQSESREILDRIMSTAGRRLTSQQSDLILQAFESCAIPLYLHLAAGVAVKWRSYSVVGIDDIAKDVPGLIVALFDRLEKLYGRLLTSHALAYITAASNGLSRTELEDVLSCDDDVLTEVYQYWVPPIRRIPPLLWLRIRQELASYLVERGSDGLVAYSWYHRQFKDVAEKRYLVESASEVDIRLALADYFDGKWTSGKPYRDKDGNARPSADRRISRQPICLFGDRESGRTLNMRMLRELPFQLLKLRDWKRFEEVCCRLEFVEARFEAEQGHDCLLEFEEAARMSDVDVIAAWCKFIRASFGRLVPQPIAIYQLAAQQASSSPVRKHLMEIDIPDCVALMVDTRPIDVEDPCQMTLLGHKGYVACCCYSPDGQLAASTGDDGALRVWNAVTGTGLCCVVDERLSGSVCRFSYDERHLATGTRSGQLLIWELTDMHLSQISAEDAHDQAITQIVCSPDSSKLAMSSLDGSVSIYSVPEYRLLGKVVVGGYAKGCDFSGNSRRLCVALNESTANIAIIDVETHEVTARGQETLLRLVPVLLRVIQSKYIEKETDAADSKDYITCCSFSPDDKLVVSSKNRIIIVWEAVLCRPVRRMTATDVVTCLAVLSDGSKLISGHRNGAVSAWDISNATCIAAFRGHASFVRHLTLHPVNKTEFLTASGDRSLKVWDLEAVLSGRVLPDTGRRCVDASVSPDRRFIVCRTSVFEYVIVCASTGQQVGDSFASSVPPAFTSDSNRLLSIAESSVGEMQVRFAPGWTLATSVPLTFHCNTIACSHRFIVCFSYDDDGCELHLLDVNDYQPVRTLSLTFEVSSKTSVACSPISDDVAVGYYGGIRVINLSQSEPEQMDLTTTNDTEPEMETSHVLYTPDGRHLLGIREDGAIFVWQTSTAVSVGYSLTRSLMKRRDDDKVPVTHAQISPNSEHLLTVTEDHVLILRNLTHCRKLSGWFESFPCAYFVSSGKVVAIDANATVRCLKLVEKNIETASMTARVSVTVAGDTFASL